MSSIPQMLNAGSKKKFRNGFTLVELLVVIAIIAVLSSILLPALAKSKARAQGIFCLNNTKQLTLAWIVYSDDHNGKLAYNLGSNNTNSMEANWANNVLDWDLSSDNTNTMKLVDSGIGPYANRSAGVFRCPSDTVLSGVQQGAGWSSRVRTYSMNAMIGDAGGFSQSGFNVNNPDYVQFFKYSVIPRPADIFVFVEEHPDSIRDGYFLNKSEETRWYDLPASFHDGAANFSFVDGHAEAHRWHSAATRQPARANVIPWPLRLNRPEDYQDFLWVIRAMSIERGSGYYHYN